LGEEIETLEENYKNITWNLKTEAWNEMETCSVQNSNIEWKNYNGTIPQDAVVSEYGYGSFSSKTYIIRSKITNDDVDEILYGTLKMYKKSGKVDIIILKYFKKDEKFDFYDKVEMTSQNTVEVSINFFYDIKF
jgi:hypothetical protein